MKSITVFIASFLFVGGVFSQGSIRFFGNGVDDIDRVKIPIDDPLNSLPGPPADVGATDFTVEVFIKCAASESNGSVFNASNGDGWITGNVVIDRDIYGTGNHGDWGIAVGRPNGASGGTRVVAFGCDRMGSGITRMTTSNVCDNGWHHVAVTREVLTGAISIYVDGSLEASGVGPGGDISYNDAYSSQWPNDPYLVLGAEKHDAGTEYPSFSGFLDELRISTTIRYQSGFSAPSLPFMTDNQTALLMHFDEGQGLLASDSSGNGTNGLLSVGGVPEGPVWSTDTPFSASCNGLGDFNQDCSVNFSDLVILLAIYGAVCTCPQDLNFDTQVDFSDLTVFLSLYGF